MKHIFVGILLSSTLLFGENHPGFVEVKDLSTLEILTPSLKTRKTAKIRLDNGLEAYLISDPKADQSAAALSMEVGSWDDDPRYPGIAHFLEHLLFMGSKTYPEENAYDKQVWDNGGTINAYTAPDRTVYIFSVNNDAFPLTLDMFSHMFADPLFSPSGIGRELYAVDQEHDKNIENDSVRGWMVFKETGNPNHPNALFNTGNSETLGGIPQNEVISWYETNYSADKAHLVLYSPLPIEELKGMTVRLFSNLPKTATPKKGVHAPLFSEKQEGHIIAVKPIKELRELSIEWELPAEYAQNLENHSHSLLGYILGGRHSSSLYMQLKNEGLVENVYSGLLQAGKESALFSIGFDLTTQGAELFETVIERCFQTLNGLKQSGIPPYIFEEMKTMATIDYAYQSRSTPFSFVSSHASKMINEPLETYPQKTLLPTTYNFEEIENFLKNLSPDKALYFLVGSPDLTGLLPDKKEQWSGAEYCIQNIPKETLNSYSSLLPHSAIAIPSQNPFIPSNLKLVTKKEEHQAAAPPIPTKLLESEKGVLYYFEDSQYQVPEVSLIFNISSPQINETAKSAVLLDLFHYALDAKLAPTLAFASPASLGAKAFDSDLKLQIAINGFSEKAPLLMETVLQNAKKCYVTKEDFEIYTTSLKSYYANQAKAMPVMQALQITQNILFNNAPMHTEKLSALKNISHEEYLRFAEKLFDEAFVEAMLAGNLTEKDAQNIWQTMQNTLSYTPYPKKSHNKKQMLTLSAFQGPFKITAETKSLGNAAILVVQEGLMTFPKKASQLVLGAALQEDFFDTLRTKQQTGYLAKSGTAEAEEQLYKFFMVQSSTHGPDELIARFELFLEGYIKDFETALPEGRFELLKSNVITTVETPPTNLGQMANYLNSLAFTHKEDFARKEKLIGALKELTYEELKKDTIAFLSRKNSKRIAIMLEGNQPKEKTFRYEPITAETLKAEGTYISLP